MANIADKNQSAKLVVDCYEECEDLKQGAAFGILTCQCYIPCDTSEQYIERQVRMSDLYEYVKGDEGEVWVTPGNDWEELVPVNFYDWYETNKHSQELYDVLSDLINKREKRTSLMNLPDIGAAIAKVMDSHYLQIKNQLS